MALDGLGQAADELGGGGQIDSGQWTACSGEQKVALLIQKLQRMQAGDLRRTAQIFASEEFLTDNRALTGEESRQQAERLDKVGRWHLPWVSRLILSQAATLVPEVWLPHPHPHPHLQCPGVMSPTPSSLCSPPPCRLHTLCNSQQGDVCGCFRRNQRAVRSASVCGWTRSGPPWTSGRSSSRRFCHERGRFKGSLKVPQIYSSTERCCPSIAAALW